MIYARLNTIYDEFEIFGLHQYDYGQVLKIEGIEKIPDGTEMQFYQERDVVTYSIKDMLCDIPNSFLKKCEDIDAYIYIENETCGSTLKHLILKISERPMPDNYVEPGNKVSEKKLIPPGGLKKMLLSKNTDEDYDIVWRNLDTVTEKDIDIIFENTGG